MFCILAGAVTHPQKIQKKIKVRPSTPFPMIITDLLLNGVMVANTPQSFPINMYVTMQPLVANANAEFSISINRRELAC